MGVTHSNDLRNAESGERKGCSLLEIGGGLLDCSLLSRFTDWFLRLANTGETSDFESVWDWTGVFWEDAVVGLIEGSSSVERVVCCCEKGRLTKEVLKTSDSDSSFVPLLQSDDLTVKCTKRRDDSDTLVCWLLLEISIIDPSDWSASESLSNNSIDDQAYNHKLTL